MSDEQYIGAEEAARILRVSSRMVYRYGEEGKLRTIRPGRRILFHIADVHGLAEAQDAEHRPSPRTEIITGDEAIGLIREQQNQLMLLSRRIGELEGMLSQRLLPADEQALRSRVNELESELTRLQLALEQAQQDEARPWWRRVFGS